MLRKAHLLFRARNADREALADAIAAQAAPMFEAISEKPGARVRVAALLPGISERTVHGEVMGGTAFDAALEIGFDEADLAELIPLVEGLGGRVDETCDRAASYALVGTEYPFATGVTQTVLLIAMSRALSMSYEDYHRYWLNRHWWRVKPN